MIAPFSVGGSEVGMGIGHAYWRQSAMITAAIMVALSVLAAQQAPAQPVPAQQAPAQQESTQEAASAVMPTVTGPFQPTPILAKRADKANPGLAPEGANDFACRPGDRSPVLLVHGTDASAYSDFASLAPRLRLEGYCVFALNYGVGEPGLDLSPTSGHDVPTYGTADIRSSAAEVADAVQRIQRATGASTVDLVGFSQGANVARYYTNKLGGARHVDAWIGIATPTYGNGAFSTITAIPGAPELLAEALAPALVQQIEGSDFLRELNSPVDTVAGVSYTTINTRHDEVIQPLQNAALRGPGARGIILQDLCPLDMSGHFQLLYNLTVHDLVLGALDPRHEPSAACQMMAPGVGLVETFVASNS
ncbi:esterase/lipase family protein [Lolliginicoccus levis]|uniref:esterase/lipase family protein n=1 Tax=Lolliginicoccus levis TaxID=2919542 RepID=UPI00241C957A|nr:alpha/beta fold hydrolase [Lolliginicoccus levis]